MAAKACIENALKTLDSAADKFSRGQSFLERKVILSTGAWREWETCCCSAIA
jgi:hypothetical protein